MTNEDLNMPENPDTENNENPTPPDELEETLLTWFYKDIPDFYNRVRSALNVGMAISDNVIDYFENAPLAERRMKKRVPNWQELDEIKKQLFESCIIYMTCAALCPVASTMRITKQKDPSLEVNYASTNNDKPCARFLDLVEDLVAQINDEEMPPWFWGFRVTPPTPPFSRVRVLPRVRPCIPPCPPPKEPDQNETPDIDVNIPPDEQV